MAGARRLIIGLTMLLCCIAGRAVAAPLDDCNSGDVGKMLSGCTAVLATATDPAITAAALARRGFAHKQRRECDAAIEDLTGALAVTGRNAAILVLRGQCHIALNHPQSALTDFEAALQIEPGNAEALAAVGPLRAQAAAEASRPQAAAAAPSNAANNAAAAQPKGGGVAAATPNAGSAPLSGKPDERSYLGLVLQRVTDEIARSIGLSKSQGALIAGVIPGSPANRAGLQAGDVILTFDGKPYDFADAMKLHVTPGEKVALSLWRDGKQLPLAVTAAQSGERPQAEVSPYCHVEWVDWQRGQVQEYVRFVNTTTGFTCQFTYTIKGDPVDFKITVTGGSRGKWRSCGALCFTYQARAPGRDRLVVVICKPGDRPSGAECVSADKYGVARIVYEVRIEDPVWKTGQSSAPAAALH